MFYNAKTFFVIALMTIQPQKQESRYELIIYDWDGTLMDSVTIIAESLIEALKETQMPMVDLEKAKSVIGLPLTQALTILTPQAEEPQLEELMQAYKKHFVQRADTELKPFQGVYESLMRLRQKGVKLAVATGKSRAGLERDFHRCSMQGIFHSTRTVNECKPKPNPHMIEDILSELDVEPQNAIMVGDTTYDLEMAKNAGVAAIASTYGAHRPEILHPFEALGYFKSYNELHDWLNERV